MTIYPLLLKPPLKDIGEVGLFNSEYENDKDKETSAESLMLSCRKDKSSLIQNGELAGKTLPEAVDLWGKAALGEKAAGYPSFPILIKLLDAREKQLINVHPDKTELWYIVDCEPGARLIYGFNAGLTKEDFKERIQNDTLSKVCNFVPVKKGDVFLIEAGTIHAVGAGMLVAEVEQSPRASGDSALELDDDKAAETTLLRPSCTPCGAVGEIIEVPGGTCRRLSSTDLFTVQLLEITGSMLVGCIESFMSLLCVEGCCTLEWTGGRPLVLKKGTSVFLPAGVTAHIKVPPETKSQLLCSRI